MGIKKYKLIYLKIGQQTLENYEKWWNSYKNNIIKNDYILCKYLIM